MADTVATSNDLHPLLADLTLEDKYDLRCDRIFVSGAQAIVRLLLMQKEIDRRAGLNTAGFVSGYRGSPLGALDQQLFRAKRHLDAAGVVFEPGLNEDLAATAIWGAQQAEMRGEGRFDGVFSIWYGKGPGVDRSGDVFRHANLAGVSRHGGVLALMGDDHTAESSTTAHQSEFHFVDVMMPILNPAGVQEFLDYGLLGWALSRFAGVWVGLKCVTDTIESTASIDGSFGRVIAVAPSDFAMPPGGLNIRPHDPILAQEARLQDHKRDAMIAWLRANRVNKIVTSGGRHPRIGVISVGKSWLDVRQALDALGIDETHANDFGLRLYKIACPWPIEPYGLMEFARGLELIIVVEEKRSLIEVQVREELYRAAHQPLCIGKKDEKGGWLFPVKGALDSNEIALAIGERLLRRHPSEDLDARLARIRQAQAALIQAEEPAVRVPYFCSGCPHNSSTKVPEGMRAYAGIGCHFMVQWMDRSTDGFTQMGGEGANWIGEAPFSTRRHMFQNLGDGTYNHSGVLALRWAVAADVNITYKILFNDAVAMTGGQAHEGGLTVEAIARQVAAEGVARVAIVSDEPEKYRRSTAWPAGTTIHGRDALPALQRQLAATRGVTALIYDQTCAAEKRRRRKRGVLSDPDKRVLINELVCEGCGDCGLASNCVSVQPLETEFGRKRKIDQTTCNKDFSCLDGFCPSFVTVFGAKPRAAAEKPSLFKTASPSAPVLPSIHDAHPYGILVTGVGGTGVVTLGAILGMAAHLEGKSCGIIDMAGLAQKGGAVYSHVKLANHASDIHAIRIAAGEADLVLGGDMVVSCARRVLAAMRPGRTAVLIDSCEAYPGDFTHAADLILPVERIKRSILKAGGGGAIFVNASSAVKALLGASLGANFFLLGEAWQRGLVPLSHAALMRAIELNGESVESNKAAFELGRRRVADPDAVSAATAAAQSPTDARKISQTLDESIERRIAFLRDYQNGAYASRYAELVESARASERQRTPGRSQFGEAVARALFKLMAIKDEYEVARLYSNGSFARQVAAAFEGNLTFEFHLAPPIFARRDRHTGLPRKSTFGPWMMWAFKLLAALRPLRGTPFDVFGYSAERRLERRLIADYVALLEEIMGGLDESNHALAVALASTPEKIRGFGHVKMRALSLAKAEEADLLARFRSPQPPGRMAAE
ncbi:MAG TPA: indolepyruvate ferredoxin oxidoreductase family protein [Beijerinckiaceae bacterium]|nr:indolepyruvate ferredoxin oxidoreductase family protein [Beijerinckiaceae bacterium]